MEAIHHVNSRHYSVLTKTLALQALLWL